MIKTAAINLSAVALAIVFSLSGGVARAQG
jgi:hypothetical protein